MSTLSATPSRIPSVAAFAETVPGKLLIGLAATAVIAAAAHVSIALPFTPVPLTLQPLAVIGVGLALGPVAGFFTLLAYLAEGLVGLPVFSPAGPGGLAQILGPTGGYLMAYPVVAAIAGGITRLLSGRLSSFLSALVGGHLAMALLLACGAAWFSQYMHHTLYAASLYATWIGAVAPFLPGEIVKVFVAAGVYSAIRNARRIQ